MSAKVIVNGNGFVVADGVKIFRIMDDNRIQLFDGNKARASGRGDPYVYINVEDLIRVLCNLVIQQKESNGARLAI